MSEILGGGGGGEAPSGPANGHLDFYVATTGSDSNPGTIGSPFATIQHAIFVAATYDYQDLWTVTIHVADGTYTTMYVDPSSSESWFGLIPTFINPPPFGIFLTIVGNHATPANVVLQGPDTSGHIGFGCHAYELQVLIDGFTLTGLSTGFFWNSGILNYGNLTFGSMTTFGTCFNISRANARLQTAGGQFITFTSASYFIFASGANETNLSFQSTNFAFPATCSFGTFVGISGFTQLNWFANIYVNFGGVTATNSFTQQGIVISDTAQASDFPGGVVVADNTILWVNANTGLQGVALTPNAGVPTTAALVPNSYGVFRDTVGGGSYLAINNNGTLNILQIPTAVGISATIATAKLTAGGTNGSMTFVDGILTAQTPAT